MEQLHDDLWIVEGPEIPFLGVTIGTRMTIARMGEELWLHSPIQLTENLSTELSRLGQIRYLVSPNNFHHLFLGDWQTAFPDSETFAMPGLTQKRNDISVKYEILAGNRYPWSEILAHDIFGPNRMMDEAVFFHTPSKTLILTDLIVNVKTDGFGFFQKLFAAFDGLGYPGGSTPRLYRWGMKSKKAARQVFRQMQAWDPERVIISHGEWFREHGRAEIEKRLAWVGE